MKIAVVGGGPAGLFFAALMKRNQESHEVTVYEQNAANMTYGFGVGFSETALNFLQKVDSTLHEEILASSEHLKHLTIVHQEVRVSISGNDFHGVERIRLLNLLRKRALTSGVRLLEDYRVKSLEDLEEYDLVVGADGINSLVRRALSDHFQPIIRPCRNMWIWYATSRVSDGIELIFKETNAGLFIGHTYRYRNDRNTFVVECTPKAWHQAGFDTMSEVESRHYCENVFSDFLRGCPLISNQSLWFTPKIIKTVHWVSGNATLLGDALKTMHPSIGSGTRAAMQDAIALADACLENQHNVEAALTQFEQKRRPHAEKLQDSAIRSIEWYESVNKRLHLSPVDFAYDYMKRTGKIDHERMRQMDPDFVRAYESLHQEVQADHKLHLERTEDYISTTSK